LTGPEAFQLDDPPLAGVVLRHVVHGEAVLDPGLRGQAVGLQTRAVHDVANIAVSGQEGVGEQPAMASPPL